MCVSVMSVCVRVSECVCVSVWFVWVLCVWERQEAGGRRKRKKEKEEGGADTELKTKTPHVNVGNKHLLNHKTLDMAYVN